MNTTLKLGADKNGNPVLWPLLSPAITNRHALILGQTGRGKTYMITQLLDQLKDTALSALVFDYCNSYPASTFASPPDEIIVYRDGLKIDPFKRQIIAFGDVTCPEKKSDVADRISDLLMEVLNLTFLQRNAVYSACLYGLMDSSPMTLGKLVRKLADLDDDRAREALGKLSPIADKNIFSHGDLNWGNLLYTTQGKVTVINLKGFSQSIQKLITELLLWALWDYVQAHGSTDKPFVVVLDECQRLSLKEDSIASRLLTEGRKYGVSAWFATQFLQGNFKAAEINRLQQCDLKVNFKSTEKENRFIAKELDAKRAPEWEEKLQSLKRGQCIVRCPLEKADGSIRTSPPLIVNVPKIGL